MQSWSVPLHVFRILKQELPNVEPVDYMKHLRKLNTYAVAGILALCDVEHDTAIEDAISQVFIKQRPGTSEILLKYMPTVQYGRMWNKFYRQCRGTVIDMDKMIAFHSYDKFGNLGEFEGTDEQSLIELSHRTDYRVMNKWDGSLITFYFNNGQWNASTNGSFESDQAKWAMEYANRYNLLDVLYPGYTYMYEAIYPENRIVVNYGQNRGLVMLAFRDNEYGKLHLPRRTDKLYEDKTFEQILSERDKHPATKKEGWVVRFDNGLMVKVKCTDYVKVHKLKEQITPKGVFDMIQTDTLDDVRSNVPSDIQREIDDIVAVYVQWERGIRDKIASIDVSDVSDGKAVYTAVRSVFPTAGFEQWYALKCVRGDIDAQQSPLSYVKTFDKVQHLFDN